jgi:hypothetical protein
VNGSLNVLFVGGCFEGVVEDVVFDEYECGVSVWDRTMVRRLFYMSR